MSAHEFVNSSTVFIELGASSLKAVFAGEALELPLDREATGKLTNASREKVINGLRNFVRQKGWQPKLRALCAIGARGVMVRRLTVPAAGKDEIQRLLLLQIESELPLPPDELAWGYREMGPANGNGNGGAKSQEILVVAAKKEVLAEPEQLLATCGLSPVFTLAGLVRGFACPQPIGSCAFLEIGKRQSELVVFDKGIPTSVRSIAWGGDSINLAIQAKLGVGNDEAEKLKLKLDTDTGTSELDHMVQETVNAAFDALAASVKANWSGTKLYLSSKTTRNREIAGRLARSLGGVDCERVEAGDADAHSAAIRGMKKAVEKSGTSEFVLFQSPEARAGIKFAEGTPWKWIARAAALALILALFPYVEAFALRGRLTKKLTEVKEASSRLSLIDSEQSLLEYLKLNQPPYLDAVYVIATCTAQGSHIDSINMNRRGEVMLRGSMPNAQQLTEFRSKMIKSGFFSNVSVEEQAPGQGQGPDRQKLTVRISAEWKNAPAREALALGPTKEEMEKLKEQTKKLQFGAPQMGGPMGMPMDMSIMMPPADMQPPRSGAHTNPAARPPRKGPTVFPGQLPPGVELPPGVVIQMNQ